MLNYKLVFNQIILNAWLKNFLPEAADLEYKVFHDRKLYLGSEKESSVARIMSSAQWFHVKVGSIVPKLCR